VYVETGAPLPLSVCCRMADTEPCVDHAQHAEPATSSTPLPTVTDGHRQPYDLNSSMIRFSRAAVVVVCCYFVPPREGCEVLRSSCLYVCLSRPQLSRSLQNISLSLDAGFCRYERTDKYVHTNTKNKQENLLVHGSQHKLHKLLNPHWLKVL